VRAEAVACLALVLGGSPAWAQNPTSCRILCAPEFKLEPTITFATLFNSPRVILDDGASALGTKRSGPTLFGAAIACGVALEGAHARVTGQIIQCVHSYRTGRSLCDLPTNDSS
jgi:hypothetical protein